MRLFFEPTEPLLFRTGRPFDVGENNFAESIFPPTPETLQGAVRAMIATHWDIGKTLDQIFQQPELTALIGDRTQYGRFRITGITLGRYKKENAPDMSMEQIFPAPSHILQEEDGEKRQVRLIPRKTQNDIQTDLPDNMQLLYPGENIEDSQGKLEPVRGWLTENGLQTALWTNKDIAKEDIISSNDIFVTEPRMGIGMNNVTKTTQEGQLYQVQKLRMNPHVNPDYFYGFIIDVRLALSSTGGTVTANSEPLVDDDQTQKLLKLPDKGWVTLGGERRAAHFTVLHSQSSRQIPKRQGTLLYLATPTVLKGGWRPQTWRSPLVPPVAASINRYQPIGGWRLVPGSGAGENKTMYRCVPAGSVYFFDQIVTIPEFLTDDATNQDWNGWQIGYGITYAGDWK
ncbi:MAG TPA: type III-B CRISPR module-associated protein Cmr3 [Ktedonobacteraceae bacterium]|nr:type III-B CRISPR module-associated protein Cmr3 [Ktedonobacteraceae bacterium]